MKRPLGVLFLLGFAATAGAAETYVIDSTHTIPVFEVNHLGFSTQRGRFNGVSGKIVLDMAARKGTVDVAIDARSLNTGVALQEEHLKGKEFFDVEKYPQMTFRSRKLNFTGDTLTSVEGDFTLLGVTRPLTLDVAHFRCGMNPIHKAPECGADASATLRRSDFGMTAFVPAVSDEVKLLIPVEALKE